MRRNGPGAKDLKRYTAVMKKLLALLLAVGVIAGGYYLVRLLPLVATDNPGGAKVVLLHGLGRSVNAMLLLESDLTKAGFDVHNIGYPSTEAAPEVLVELVSEAVDACCTQGHHTVHFVGHSLGGLLIRAYLAEQRPTDLGRVVLIASPNKGSELADVTDSESLNRTLLELAGPTAQALQTDATGFPAQLPAPDYPVGVIAGTRGNPVADEWLPQPNDGLVSVASAQLDGMTDFVTFPLTHWRLRSDPRVTAQVVAFLVNGEFSSEDE